MSTIYNKEFILFDYVTILNIIIVHNNKSDIKRENLC
jgi:hypothetical protein